MIFMKMYYVYFKVMIFKEISSKKSIREVLKLEFRFIRIFLESWIGEGCFLYRKKKSFNFFF